MFCQCFADKPINPVCTKCEPRDDSHLTETSFEPTLPRMQFLIDETSPKSCLVHIIRCLSFKVQPIEGTDAVCVALKMIISDGSTTALGYFVPEKIMASGSSPSLRQLANLLGLEESITRQLVAHMFEKVNVDANDPFNVGLSAWLASPGFLRQVWLTLEKDPGSSSAGSYWRLNKVNMGREIFLAIPPMPKFRVIN